MLPLQNASRSRPITDAQKPTALRSRALGGLTAQFGAQSLNVSKVLGLLIEQRPEIFPGSERIRAPLLQASEETAPAGDMLDTERDMGFGLSKPLLQRDAVHALLLTRHCQP